MYVRGYLQGSENGRVVTIASNGYKSQKFVSLIDAPYFKNAFAPGASIRRNTVHVSTQ